MNTNVLSRHIVSDLTDFSDPSMTLAEWQDKINELIEEYGENATLEADAGYNNISMYIVEYKNIKKSKRKHIR